MGKKANIIWDVKNNRVLDLDQYGEQIIIGRCDHSPLSFEDDEKMSGEHISLKRKGHEWFISDLHSTNGTFLNNGQLPPDDLDPLISYSVMRIGNQILLYLDDCLFKINDRINLIEAVRLLDDSDEVSFHVKSKSIAFCKITLPELLQQKEISSADHKIKMGEALLKEKLSLLDADIEKINEHKKKIVEKWKSELDEKILELDQKYQPKLDLLENKKEQVKENILSQIQDLGEKKNELKSS